MKTEVKELIEDELAWLSDFLYVHHGISRSETRRIIVELLKTEEIIFDKLKAERNIIAV